MKMNDFERDKIDSDAAKLMQTCSEAIKILKRESKYGMLIIICAVCDEM